MRQELRLASLIGAAGARPHWYVVGASEGVTGKVRWSGSPPGVCCVLARSLDPPSKSGHITSMALTRKKATTIALDPRDDRLLSRAARARGVSRSEFIRQHLSLVLEQYRRHPKPRSAGIARGLAERGDERELFGGPR